MSRIHLSGSQREELQRRCRIRSTRPRTRDRLEMIRLSEAGWSLPRIAEHFGRDPRAVRRWVKGFLQAGFEALEDQPRRGLPERMSPEAWKALRERVGRANRTWTARQLAEWLPQEQGISLSADRLRFLLRREKLSYKRTNRELRHKQKPEEVAAKTEELEAVKRGPRRS